MCLPYCHAPNILDSKFLFVLTHPKFVLSQHLIPEIAKVSSLDDLFIFFKAPRNPKPSKIIKSFNFLVYHASFLNSTFSSYSHSHTFRASSLLSLYLNFFWTIFIEFLTCALLALSFFFNWTLTLWVKWYHSPFIKWGNWYSERLSCNS